MPKLSAEKRRELQKLAKRPDSEIDCSDIPEIRELTFRRRTGGLIGPRRRVSRFVWIRMFWRGSKRLAKGIKPGSTIIFGK